MKNKLIICLLSIIICIVVLCSYSYTILLKSRFVLNNNYSVNIEDITEQDVYDVILFWGQSNMVGFCGLSDTSSVTYGEKIKDSRYDYTNTESVETFSKKTGIDVEYIKNSEKMNYVRIEQADNTVYEYKYLNNTLEEITENTELYGEKLSYTDQRCTKGG